MPEQSSFFFVFEAPFFPLTKARRLSETNAIGKRPNVTPTIMEACKHPRVRVVSREEDSEFLECLECGEVFDSTEFSDMEIEDNTGDEGPENAESKPD